MAWKTKTERFMLDDFDQSAASQEIAFAFEGVTYEIHLNDERAEEFRRVIAPYINVARRSGGRRRRGTGPVNAGPSDAAKIRVWAREQGLTVPDRGRIPADVRDAYYASH